MDDAQLESRIRASLLRARDDLLAAGARDEAVATFVPARKVVVFTRSATMAPLGRAWRLGVFLLAADASLFATGSITRAVEPGRAQYQSISAETRRAYRAAAFKGPFAKGETVNYDATAIDLGIEALRASTGPLFVVDDRALVRWNAKLADSEAVDLDAYLGDRVSLLVDPPLGA